MFFLTALPFARSWAVMRRVMRNIAQRLKSVKVIFIIVILTVDTAETLATYNKIPRNWWLRNSYSDTHYITNIPRSIYCLYLFKHVKIYNRFPACILPQQVKNYSMDLSLNTLFTWPCKSNWDTIDGTLFWFVNEILLPKHIACRLLLETPIYSTTDLLSHAKILW